MNVMGRASICEACFRLTLVIGLLHYIDPWNWNSIVFQRFPLSLSHSVYSLISVSKSGFQVTQFFSQVEFVWHVAKCWGRSLMLLNDLRVFIEKQV
jgi:hypothetical protein